MTNSEILKLAIDKAKLNGFTLRNLEHYHVLCDVSPTDFDDVVYYYVIFNYKFAKAFWGERAEEKQIMNYTEKMNNLHNICRWQYHLQQMVLCEEPLKYLEKFLR